MIFLESISLILIHHTFTRSACIHVTTGKRGFESHCLHWVFIEIHLIIFNAYDIVTTLYKHTMLALCVLNHYVSFYKVIFIIYLLLIVSSRRVIPNPRSLSSSACRVLTDCATTVLSKTRHWLFIYKHIHSFWDWNNTYIFFVATGLNMDKLNTFFTLSFPRIYICKYLYIIHIK